LASIKFTRTAGNEYHSSRQTDGDWCNTGMKFRFYGNGSYCYANSTAMLLSTVGEEISPSTIEVLSGVGLGATWFPRENTVLIGNIATAPDTGISSALRLLGFEYIEKNADQASPLDELKRVISRSPVAAGPVDAGFLDYNPFHRFLSGVDHFVFVYKFDEEGVHLHDPEGYPYSTLEPARFLDTWKAEKIEYRRGAYRYWASPRRSRTVNDHDLSKSALQRFRELYHLHEDICRRNALLHGAQALKHFADHAESGRLNDEQKNRLVNFTFPVSAKRSTDYADFFEHHGSQALAELKEKHAETFGNCQGHAVSSDWKSVAETLRHVAQIEDEFQAALQAA
jgi:hypothetical protein